METSRLPRPATEVDWQILLGPEITNDLAEFLDLSAPIAPPDERAGIVDALASQAAHPRARVRTVVDLVNTEVEYVPGSTTVQSTAAEVWDARTGVCQDMAQLAIGMLRRAGAPAHYVSGYLMSTGDAEMGQPVTGQSHAWIEAWDRAWLAFDPTNRIVPGRTTSRWATGGTTAISPR